MMTFRSRALPSLSVWTIRLPNIKVVWPVKTKRSIGESEVRGRCAPAPCETLALLRPSPLAGPYSLCRPRTKREPEQWLALRAEWLRRSSTNPLPLWQKQNPHLFCWREADPPCKSAMNTARPLNTFQKKKIQVEKWYKIQITCVGASREHVLCSVSPLFITDWVYTIQAYNLTFVSSCWLYLCLQASLISLHFLHFAVQAHLWRCSKQGQCTTEGKRVCRLFVRQIGRSTATGASLL